MRHVKSACFVVCQIFRSQRNKIRSHFQRVWVSRHSFISLVYQVFVALDFSLTLGFAGRSLAGWKRGEKELYSDAVADDSHEGMAMCMRGP